LHGPSDTLAKTPTFREKRTLSFVPSVLSVPSVTLKK
jgi:hypothetical protein